MKMNDRLDNGRGKRRAFLRWTVGAVLLAISSRGACEPINIWWEGEDTVRTNFTNQSGFRPEALRNPGLLSGRNWLNTDGFRRGAELFAEYRVKIPGNGRYSFWCRKFWKHGSFKWRFDSGRWRLCGENVLLADSTDLAPFICANWVKLGDVEISEGEHVLEIRLRAREGENAGAAFDAFLLTDGLFVPRGLLKPGETSGAAREGYWPFEPDADAFSDSPIDFRWMNESVAGESGFLRREGADIVTGAGKRVRFWGVNMGGDALELDDSSMAHLARWLAKRGVNIVRMHGGLWEDGNCRKIDARRLDRLHRMVESLKGQGIYTALSFYFPLWISAGRACGIAGYEGFANRHPFALLFFSPQMQKIHRGWILGILKPRNPYSGIPLARDPALAMVEVVNEDSFLFWTFSSTNIPPVQMRILEDRFAKWLGRKYGSATSAAAAWGEGAFAEGDSPDEGRIKLADAFHMTSRGRGEGGKRKRMSDQLRFLVETQREFYDMTAAFLRKEAGLRSMVVCSNWTTADPSLLDSLERYTYMAGDMLDEHGYFGGRHEGPAAGYSVNVGDTYEDLSALGAPGEIPGRFDQVSGFPHVISEIGWTNPNRFKGEFPFICSVYGSLQGADGFFFFALGGPYWETGARKFALAVPSILGQFPAAALAYRRGDVMEGPVVLNRTLSMDDLFDFQGEGSSLRDNLDELRRAGIPEAAGRGSAASSDPEALAYFCGKVSRSIGSEGGPAWKAGLGGHVDSIRKIVTSATGEISWDWGRKVITVNSPRTQGACGFLGSAGEIRLKDVAIKSGDEYVSVLVVSLDGRSLSGSGRILVQVFTEEEPFGWHSVRGKILSLGDYPLTVRKSAVALKFMSIPSGAMLTALDENGYPRSVHAATPVRAGSFINLPADALYFVIR